MQTFPQKADIVQLHKQQSVQCFLYNLYLKEGPVLFVFCLFGRVRIQIKVMCCLPVRLEK